MNGQVGGWVVVWMDKSIFMDERVVERVDA